MVSLVVERGIWYQPTLLARQVYAETIAKAHGHHIVAPSVHGILDGLILGAVAHHVEQSPTKESVARGAYGRDEAQRRGVAMASHVKSLVVESPVARILGCGRNNAFRKEGKPLRRLECGAGGILSHDGTVQQRLLWIPCEKLMILVAALPLKKAWVIGRRRHHAKYLARGGLYGDDGTNFSLHHALAKGLQVNVKAKGEFFARHWTTVESAMLVMPLYPAVGIAQENLHALYSAEFFLVASLHAQLAYIVARLIIAVIINVALRNLRHLA